MRLRPGILHVTPPLRRGTRRVADREAERGGPAMTGGTRERFRFGALTLMLVLVIAYTLGLALKGDDFSPLVDGWLAMLSVWAPVLVGCAAVYRVGRGQIEVGLASAALTMNALADTYYLVSADADGASPFPSPADIGYLLFYLLLLWALAVLVNRQLRGSAWSVFLDTAVGSLGAAAVLAVILSPVFDSAAADPLSLGAVIAAAYPVLDLLVVAAIAGIVASHGPDAGKRWMLLVAGLVVFAGADTVFALQGDLYTVGTLLDATWNIGVVLIALWVDGTSLPRPVRDRRATATTVSALAVPMVSTIAGLGVLILASQVTVSNLAVALAGATMALAVVPLVGRQRVLNLLARTDDLTGLRNRRAFNADVPTRLAAVEGRTCALLLLDLDRFKEVNDSLGHDVGDRLLIQVGIRLNRQLRAGDLLARLGGDEFAILLTDSAREDALTVAVKLRAALAEPFILEGITLQTSASVGISLYPDQGKDLTALLRKADMAMYKAKTSRGGHHVYDSDDDSHGETRLRTLAELRLALTDEQLVLHYQPKVDLGSGAVRGVEALVRWNHPERGLLLPDQFVPIIEEAGLMHTLTQVVLRQALDQAVLWQAQGHPLTIAVNLSASSLVDTELPDRIGAMIAARGLPSSILALEITEEFLLNDRGRARGILTRLREQDIRISVDDFGTGYSSLAYLRDLPIDELKLDRSFVFPMAGDARAATLVSSTIALAHSLGLRMVAEGVDSGAAYDQLVSFGCDFAQGFHLSQPLSAAELDTWLADRRVADTASAHACEVAPAVPPGDLVAEPAEV
ncbi:EAL domain-containing protein [Cryobacterium sp. TMT1-62]|nr:EAL domain-containing protein [Cryobacterium sp. TMT1-62]